ncbi:MAG: CrcB family protein [Puniceicoccales bacterium]|jgi:CrcB protein|nr:CrcB family protein [Puniceicoccales bacterium]
MTRLCGVWCKVEKGAYNEAWVREGFFLAAVERLAQPRGMNLQWACLVAAGGAAGALLRGCVALALKGEFPWATLLVNVLGAFLVGFVMGRTGAWDEPVAMRWHALLVTGFCGGFTTFSAFSWQTLEQMHRGQTWFALGNIALTLLLPLAAVWLGFRLR